jgi:hypothetical protein
MVATESFAIIATTTIAKKEDLKTVKITEADKWVKPPVTVIYLIHLTAGAKIITMEFNMFAWQLHFL